MPAKLVSVINMKGGVGKSTTTVSLAETLAHHQRRRVLVIENEPVIQQAMAALLQAWGCQPITAASLEQAIERLEMPPDAILADYRLLEGQTGIQAVKGLHAHFKRQIPAAIITGDTDPTRIAEARASGFPLLQKPTPSAHLREVLSGLLQTSAKAA